MSPLRIRWKALLPYVFSLLLVQLGRFFISDYFGLIFFLMLLLPIVSMIHAFLTSALLKYHQRFDTEHPVKGTSLGFTLTLANESVLPGAAVLVRFMVVQPGMAAQLPDLRLCLGPGAHEERQFSISCPYRGIYTVGLASLEITDVLGWLTVRKAVWHRTFYVYPRVIDLDYPFGFGTLGEAGTGRHPGASQDYALFEGLRPYTRGADIRHMAWKRFISLGEPFLKSYGRSSQPGVTLYLDLRRNGPPTPEQLTREDCSVEIVVALVKYCLDRSVPVDVHAMGNSRYDFSSSDPAQFPHFHRDTVNIMFGSSVSPVELFRGLWGRQDHRSSVVFVTHEWDMELLDFIESSHAASVGDGGVPAAIINQTHVSQLERVRRQVYLESLREKGARVASVTSPDSIAEDLAQYEEQEWSRA